MAPNQTQKSASNLQVLFRALGVMGIVCVLAGFIVAIYNHTSFTLPAFILIGLGALMFLLLFIKAELANLKYYLHVIVYSAMVTCICVFAYLFARQYEWKKDLTK